MQGMTWVSFSGTPHRAFPTPLSPEFSTIKLFCLKKGLRSITVPILSAAVIITAGIISHNIVITEKNKGDNNKYYYPASAVVVVTVIAHIPALLILSGNRSYHGNRIHRRRAFRRTSRIFSRSNPYRCRKEAGRE